MTALAKSLHRASQSYARSFAENQRGEPITVSQFLVLQVLGMGHGPLTQRGLVASTGIDRSTISTMLRVMACRGMIRMVKSKSDLRATDVEITVEGRRALKQATKAANVAHREFSRTPAAADLRAAIP